MVKMNNRKPNWECRSNNNAQFCGLLIFDMILEFGILNFGILNIIGIVKSRIILLT